MAPSDEGSSDAGDSDEEMGSDVDADQDVSKPLDPSGNGSAGPLAPERKKGTGTRPTNAEIMALNEASMLFKSNLFRLQIDELLGETLVAADTKPTRGLDAALKQIRDVLVSMEGTKEMSIDAAASLVRRLGKDAAGEVITIPFADPAPAPGLAVKLAFAAPEVVNVVGSYPLGMAVHTHGGFNVDVVVQMPPQLLQERDHLNYRYFYKRAFYVAMVRVRMHKSALNELFDIGFELLRNDTRLPVVVLRPKADTKHLGKLGCAIRIIPSISRESLPLHRMSPTRNHVRPSYILEAGGATVEGDTAGAEPPATPQYNAAVLADALLLTHMKYLFETTEMCPEFPRGAALLRIWLAQRVATGRQIGTRRLLGTRRINGFVLTMVLAWLVRVPRTGTSAGTRLTGSMNAHQLFKGAVEFLASHDFGEDP
ncbi:U3 snoRNP protein, partial [Coemansia biformis]